MIFEGQCAELCGRNHANMYGRVVGMRMEDYRAWYAKAVEDLKAAKQGAAEQQEGLEQQQQDTPASEEEG